MCNDERVWVVKDLMDLILETDVPEAKTWVCQLYESFSSANGFFNRVLTPERAKFVVDDLCTLISRSLSYEARRNLQVYFQMTWRGHRFLDEARQKAIALGADIDLAII